MAHNLFVGGLPYETTQEELSRLFGAHGRVAAVKLIKDRDTGKSKGFGFVEMAEASAAKAAVAALNGTTVGGRRIVVNEARPQEPRPAAYTGPERRSGKERRQGWTPIAASERRDFEKKPWDKKKTWGQRYDRRPGADGEKKTWGSPGGFGPKKKSWGDKPEKKPWGDKKPGFGPKKHGFGPKKSGGFGKKRWPRPGGSRPA